jgi:cytochrome c oxidase subunit II
MQNLALAVSLFLMGLLALVFYRVTRSPAQADFTPQASYQWRWWVFVVVLVAGVAVTLISLNPWPHASATPIDRQVNVEARQWSWALTSNEIKRGERIQFNVTSVDVNHGFALYDPQQKMVAQVQAMPGFVNRVSHQFTQVGAYKILCLEYCGVAHHGMVAEIQVTE